MIKMIALLKRKPEMSFDEFIRYYEDHHRKLGEKYLAESADKYVRRYLRPVPELPGGSEAEPEYDVLTEMWFRDRSAFDRAIDAVTDPVAAAEIAADEQQLFDRSRSRFCIVSECESDL